MKCVAGPEWFESGRVDEPTTHLDPLDVRRDVRARSGANGGRIGLANWTPDGFVGQMLGTVGTHVPPPAGLRGPALWGTEARRGELFGTEARELHGGAAIDLGDVPPGCREALDPQGTRTILP